MCRRGSRHKINSTVTSLEALSLHAIIIFPQTLSTSPMLAILVVSSLVRARRKWLCSMSSEVEKLEANKVRSKWPSCQGRETTSPRWKTKRIVSLTSTKVRSTTPTTRRWLSKQSRVPVPSLLLNRVRSLDRHVFGSLIRLTQAWPCLAPSETFLPRKLV